jgi:starch-binding outer membrane protein, SusD/RagB family
LDNARKNLPADNVTGRADAYAAEALLAKAYLADFQYNGNTVSADSAIAISERIISSGEFALETNYVDLYNPVNVSDESIFEVVYDEQNFNRLAQYFYSRNLGDLSGRYEISPTTELIDSYESGDDRLGASIAYDPINLPYVIKYNDVSGGTDRVYVLRFADMYLIHAEALIYTGGVISTIQNDINAVRNRAGLGNTPASTIEDLKLALENECQHEFAFEGRRWIDVVRTGRAVSLYGIDVNYTLFPIPLLEILANGKMTQNPGY